MAAESEKMDSEAGGDLSLAVPPKKCRYCGTWSTARSPWPLLGTPLAGWDPYIPWSRGKFGKAIGDRCKLCHIVSCLLMMVNLSANLCLTVSQSHSSLSSLHNSIRKFINQES